MAAKGATKKQADPDTPKRSKSRSGSRKTAKGKANAPSRSESRKRKDTSDIAQAQEAFQREQGEHG